MGPDVASRAPLSAVQIVSPDDDGSEQRWRQWQVQNAATNRQDARRMRLVFAAIFIALGVLLAISLLAPDALPPLLRTASDR